jgi:hypothetical protein
MHVYKGDTQNIRLLGQELYFRLNEYCEENIQYLAYSQSKVVIRNLNFLSLYETLDIVLDTMQHVPSVKSSAKNVEDKYFTLREPRNLSLLVEILIGEINERLLDPNAEIRDYQTALICKAITAKPFVLDKSRPQIKTFL